MTEHQFSRPTTRTGAQIIRICAGLRLEPRTLGNAARSVPPPAYPNASAFSPLSGASHSNPSVVTVSECASHAVVDAEIGPAAGSGEQAMARRLHARLEADWLLIADRGFYSFESWTGAAASGAALLWRVKADLVLPVLELLPDGSPCQSWRWMGSAAISSLLIFTPGG
jgi:hypothetical protein